MCTGCGKSAMAPADQAHDLGTLDTQPVWKEKFRPFRASPPACRPQRHCGQRYRGRSAHACWRTVGRPRTRHGVEDSPAMSVVVFTLGGTIAMSERDGTVTRLTGADLVA